MKIRGTGFAIMALFLLLLCGCTAQEMKKMAPMTDEYAAEEHGRIVDESGGTEPAEQWAGEKADQAGKAIQRGAERAGDAIRRSTETAGDLLNGDRSRRDRSSR